MSLASLTRHGVFRVGEKPCIGERKLEAVWPGSFSCPSRQGHRGSLAAFILSALFSAVVVGKKATGGATCFRHPDSSMADASTQSVFPSYEESAGVEEIWLDSDEEDLDSGLVQAM